MVQKELKIAREAVLRASAFTRRIQTRLTARDTLQKGDKSPVTIADFAAQALVCQHLNENCPGIPIVAEEDSKNLRNPENRAVIRHILDFIGEDVSLSRRLDAENLFSAIDLGNGHPGDFFWTLDPVDGTKGFLRGAQYAVALALLSKGRVVAGVMGCPRISFEDFPSAEGYLFYASRGGGADIFNISTGETQKLRVSSPRTFAKAKFVQSFETAHGDFDLMARIARKLDITHPPVKIDSQVKYGIVAAGRAEIYLRIPNPKNPDYREKIWDHAAGSLIVTEAGGSVTDISGKPLDFSLGRELSANSGVLATLPALKDTILAEISRG